jgi:hypothetical protein
MTPKFLTFARRLALLTPTLAACASSQPAPTTTTIAPAAATSTSTEVPPSAEAGPCRCSWDTDANAAPRVCKKGEVNHAGAACVPKAHPKYPDIVEGPLPPPDLGHSQA